MRARWPSFVPTAIGLAVAVALGTAVTITQARTEEASLVQTINGLGPSGLVTVRLTGVRDAASYSQFTSDVTRASRNLGGVVVQRSVLLYSGTYTPRSINGVDVGALGPGYASTVIPLQIAVLEDAPFHADLIAGSWPSPSTTGDTIAVTLSEAAAKASHLSLGDNECMVVVGYTYTVCLRVSGLWRPRNFSDPYWGPEQSPPLAAFVDDTTYFKVLNGESNYDQPPQLVSVATVTLSPDVGAIRAIGAGMAMSRLRSLHGQFGFARADAVVVSGLESSLDQFLNQEALASFAVQLVAIQVLLIALYCVWFLAGTVLAEQRQTIAVWRSRGWSWRGVSLLLWIELAICGLVAAPIGVLGGWAASEAVARFVYRDQELPAFRVDVLKLVGPIVVVLLVELGLLAGQAILAGRHGVITARASSSRPPTAWWRSRYIDVVLGVLAIPVLAQVAELGSASVRGAGGSDGPWNLILPGLAVACVALAALRIVPLIAMALSRLRSGVAARLASVQLERAPGQHGALAMLLMLAVALGVFASTYAATASRNSADRAAYAAGSDVRGTLSGAVTVEPDKIPVAGVAARSSVFRGSGRSGAEDLPVVAVDPYTYKSVAYSRPDLTSTPMSDLIQRLADKETGGLVLPGTASAISIWVHGSGTGGSLTAHFSDQNGRPAHADLGSLGFSGWKQLSAPFVADAPTLNRPLRFRDLAISGVTTAGELAVSDLTVNANVAETFVLETFAESISGPGADFAPFLWWRSNWDTGGFAENLLPTLDKPRNGAPTAHFRVVPASIPTFIRPASTGQVFNRSIAPAGAIPTLAPSQLLSRFGLAVGKTIQVQVDNVALTALIVGVADHFPTLYSQLGDFLIMDRDPLLIALAAGSHQRPWPNEIWVRTTAGGASAAVSSMGHALGFVRVYDRGAMESAAAQSPDQLELQSNLVLGFVATTGLALLAFALHFLIVARGRLTDYAVLEANGMSPSLVRESIVIEQSALLAFCVVTGVALGLVISYVLLPGLQLGSAPSDNEPQTIVTVNIALLAALIGVVIAGALAAGAAIAVGSERPRVMAELRSLG